MSNYEKIKVGLFGIILVIVITFLFNFLDVYKQSINNKNSSHEESIEFLNEKFEKNIEKSSTNTIIGTEKEVSYTLTKMDNEIYLIKLNGPKKTIVIYSTSNLSEKPKKIYEGQLD